MIDRLNESVLVIEGDYFTGNLITRFLESAGFRVILITDASEALKAAEESVPSIILCDTELKGSDSFEILKEITSSSITNTIPFIFLSSLKPTLNDIKRGLAAGADSFIIRPFDAKELLETIRNKLDKIRQIKEKGLLEYIGKTGKYFHPEEKDNIFIDFNRKRKLIDKNDIEHIIANGAYTNLFIIGKGEVIVRKLLKDWEKTLTEHNFLKIHRSIIININYINNIERYYKRSLKICMEYSNEEFITSQRYTGRVRSVLKN